MSERRCDKCEWWKFSEHETLLWQKSTNYDTTFGFCCLKSPTVTDPKAFGRWPKTVDGAWCGQFSLRIQKPQPAALDELEEAAIDSALRQTRGHREKAAKLLNMPLRTLHRRLNKYGLDKEDYKSEFKPKTGD